MLGKNLETQLPNPPGPVGNFILGSLKEVAVNPIRLFMESTDKYGDIVRFRFAKLVAYLISNPDYIKYVFIDNASNYRKASTYKKLKPILGEGLLTSEGNLWQKQRKFFQPIFQRNKMEGFFDTITDSINLMLEKWESLAPEDSLIDISAEMMNVTLGVTTQALFSKDISNEAVELRQAFTIALEYANHRMTSLVSFSEYLPTSFNRRYKKAYEILERFVYDLISERKGKESQYHDLLSTMLFGEVSAKDEKMSDKQIRDEIMTFILAGHETTANTLSWAWYLLAVNPEVKKKLDNELKIVLNGKKPTYQDLKELKYTAMIIQEVMRLYPPIWIIERDALQDDEIGGYFIPAGAMMMLSPYVTHHSPLLWEKPEEFIPERFLPELIAKRAKFAYFPFGGGSRQCIGNHFAMMEAQLLIAIIAQKFDFELDKNHLVEKESVITLRPKYGIKMKIHKRLK